MNFSQQIKTSKSDEYYTPRYAVEIILPYIEKFDHVWCPFDKEHSEFVKVLQDNGKKLLSDILKQDKIFSVMSKLQRGWIVLLVTRLLAKEMISF